MKKMRYRMGWMVLLLLTTLSGYAQKYDSWKDVMARGSGTLTVLYFESPGLIRQSDGKLSGLCVETLNDFVSYLDTKYDKKIVIEYKKATDIGTFLNDIQRLPNILGVSAITITPERMKVMKFTTPYLASPVLLITQGEAGRLNALTDLKGMRPFSLKGGVYNDVINELGKKYNIGGDVSYVAEPIALLSKVGATLKSFTVLGMTDYLAALKAGVKVRSQSLWVAKDESYGYAMAKSSDWDIPWKEFLTPTYMNGTPYKKWITDYLGAAYLKFLNENY